jgi:formyltetrahydrofolate synthetase
MTPGAQSIATGQLRPIVDVARELQIAPEHLELYGNDRAKVQLAALTAAESARARGKLVLVSAITPTPAGEGKTTTAIGLAQGLRRIGQSAATADAFARGGAGAIGLAEKVVAATSPAPTPFKPLYPLEWPAERKIDQIARIMYGGSEVSILPAARNKLRRAAKLGYARLPICMAKTQDSLSDNPKLRGRPRDFTLTIRDIEIAAGAGFLIALAGDIVRMPGLPELPAAERIEVDRNGDVVGVC